MKRRRKRKSAIQTLTRMAATTPKKQSKAEMAVTVVLSSIVCIFIIAFICKISTKPNRTVKRQHENQLIETETSNEKTENQLTKTEIPTTETEKQTEPAPKVLHFIVNTDTGCVHINSRCSAAEAIDPVNRAEIDIPENELKNYQGVYWACGKCCSGGMKTMLPKPES